MAQSIDEICAAAEQEPPLMWYSSQDPNFNAEVVDAFIEAYPNISTDFFRLPSGALAARYASERDAGVVNADIVSLADPMFVASGLERGWFIEFDQAMLPDLARLAPEYFDRGVALTGINPGGITYNTDLAGENPPADWPDLLRPEYRGWIALADPRNVPTWMGLFSILFDQYGPDFLSQLAEQQMVVVPSAVPGTQQLAAGEFIIVFPNARAVSEPVKDQGAPVETILPPMATGVEYTTMLSADASSPNAALCLYNFLFTEVGQQRFNSTTSVSPFPGIEGPAEMPAGYRSPGILSLTPERTQEILTLLGLR
ncbi:extracellular solute-binding protein [Alterinioella nitratireducens]|uniref:extracellular solute-binding protein n=1 Tax=Alterinioella nitratireducens TaxID=2735915 RepID=UPI001553EAE4|nr:extracellular solute-binding protein [Alterinioella nitratireducens]NPD21478.1 extracellular solute-binding protein [Alterinioella nitratireducens]